MSGLTEPLPPETMLRMFGGVSAYRAQGQSWVGYFQNSCGLKPDEHVLDIGCGVGRIAIPLAQFLTSRGRYEGLDLIAARIEWCKANITARWPNFRFQQADIFDAWVNPQGTPAKEYKLPYRDEQFDFAFLISVFSHMLPEDFENYLAEVRRVLKQGGRCLSTFLLLNEESLGLLDKGKSSPDQELRHDFGHYRLASTDSPERLVAYREEFVLDRYQSAGLEIRQPIQYGEWAGRKTPGPVRQDRVFAYRL